MSECKECRGRHIIIQDHPDGHGSTWHKCSTCSSPRCHGCGELVDGLGFTMTFRGESDPLEGPWHTWCVYCLVSGKFEDRVVRNKVLGKEAWMTREMRVAAGLRKSLYDPQE